MASEITKTAHKTERTTGKKRVLIAAEHRIGHGSGHLHRCARIAPLIDGTVDWLLPTHAQDGFYSRDEALEMIGRPDLAVTWIDQPQGPYDLVILDRREADLSDLKSYNIRGICVGIDLAGEAREYCSYLIDALEMPPDVGHPNVSDPGLLNLPTNVRDEWPKEINKILVVFGGEGDGREVEIASPLSALGYDVTIAVKDATTDPSGLSVLVARDNLSEQIAVYDLVVSHYGLTPYESIWAKVPTVLINPTGYHSTLSEQAGFVEAKSASDIGSILKRPEKLIERCERIRPRGSSDITALINELRIPERFGPPSGGDRWHPATERFAERTFFLDRRDKAIYMQNYRGGMIDYDHDYFFSEYARQYGKTYLEDFPTIQAMGARRIKDILRRRPALSEKRKLLDIGCAYGPFLQAAVEAGFSVTGLDISAEATRYVEEKLGFEAVCGDVRTIDLAILGGPFDVITMWYVIEHFEDLDIVLRRVGELLRPGGVFAFSTPNGSGISASRSFREFCRRSPTDHYTIMDPKSAARLLSRFGFITRGTRVTGHHPERFDFVPSNGTGTSSRLRFHLAKALSKIGRLGDTFELIAEYPG